MEKTFKMEINHNSGKNDEKQPKSIKTRKKFAQN